MSTVTQHIPNYILGISEQPDELKLSGQVKDLKNALPDVTIGCAKRAGSKLIETITPNSGTLSWFHIYTDSEDQYIGNVNTSGVFQVWRTRDGASIQVDYSGVTGTNAVTYLTGWTDASEIQALTLNEQTFFTNRTKTTLMKSATADKSPALVNEVIVELKTISYGKQYALNIYDPANPGTPLTENRATSIAARNDFSFSTPDTGECKSMGREVINATATGKKNLRYEIDIRCIPVVDPANIGTSSSGPEYNDSYSEFAKLQFGGEGWVTGNTHSYTTTKSGTGTVEIKSHVTTTCSANIAAVRPPATSSSAEEAVTAAGILGGMKTSLDAVSNTGITATITGNCLHLRRATPFAVSTPEPQLMNVITNEASTVADLPSNCRHNYVVKIVNSGDQGDDFYLKFKQNNAGSSTSTDYFGEGVWEECPAPNIEIEIDKDTMPIKLVRELPGNTYPNGRFLAQSIDYKKRNVGDDDTNLVPSFIGSKIEKMLFFRNRLVVLSQGNVVLSKTNDFFNFFSTTAMAESTDDPIDLQASSTFPTTLHDGIEVNAGLLIFSSNQQFMLTTDSDALSPTTAKINYLSSYNYNPKTVPFSLGITSGFINSTGKNSRIFEMADVRREGEPTVLEQSKLISKLLPISIDRPTVSKENSLLLLGSVGSNEVWGFRFYNNGEKRVQSAWFRWSLTGNLLHHVVLDDVYYVVIENNSDSSYPNKVTLEAIDVKKQDDTTLIGSHFIHLDRHKEIAALATSAYDSTTNRTVFTTPNGYHSAGRLAAYVNSGSEIGQYSKRIHSNVVPTSTLNSQGHTFTVPNHGFTHGDKVIYNAEGGTPLSHPSHGSLDGKVVYLYVHNADTFSISGTSGSSGPISYYSALQGGNENQTFTKSDEIVLEGDWTGNPFMLGFLYDYIVELPTIYVTQQTGDKSRSDTRSSLVLHRLHLAFGATGNIDTVIKRKGRVDYTTNFNAAEFDNYSASSEPILQDHIHTVPIYERNTNLNIQIKSTHPSPATLHSMNWEGDYNPRYYRRV